MASPPRDRSDTPSIASFRDFLFDFGEDDEENSDFTALQALDEDEANNDAYAYREKHDYRFIVTSKLVPNPVTVYSLLPCHSLPGYGFFHNIRSNMLTLKQLECPPVQYRLPSSSKTYIYNNGDQPLPSIATLERHKVHKTTNFI